MKLNRATLPLNKDEVFEEEIDFYTCICKRTCRTFYMASVRSTDEGGSQDICQDSSYGKRADL